ncbi:MAG: hypothetical protein AABY18_04480 [Candidatus Thermoplasmatota archaeon]
MRLLVPLLVMAGLLSLAAGLLQMALREGSECAEQFQCDNFATLENALAGATFFSISLMLWGIAGALVWMRRKFDDIGT